MTLQAGLLRHRINIEERVLTQDDEGGLITTWAIWAEKVPAQMGHPTARELMVAGTMLGVATAKIVIRYRPGVVPTMRITHTPVIPGVAPVTTIYNVLGVLPDAVSGRESLTILCNTGANDGQAG